MLGNNFNKAIEDNRLHPWCCPQWVTSSILPIHVTYATHNVTKRWHNLHIWKYIMCCTVVRRPSHGRRQHALTIGENSTSFVRYAYRQTDIQTYPLQYFTLLRAEQLHSWRVFYISLNLSFLPSARACMQYNFAPTKSSSSNNWRCRLTQVDLYNGHKMAVVCCCCVVNLSFLN